MWVERVLLPALDLQVELTPHFGRVRLVREELHQFLDRGDLRRLMEWPGPPVAGGHRAVGGLHGLTRVEDIVEPLLCLLEALIGTQPCRYQERRMEE